MAKRVREATVTQRRARRRRWLKANPDANRLMVAKRRALRLGNPGSVGVRRADWTALVRRYGGRCAYCGVKPDTIYMDHVIPLVKGGRDAIGNVLPACLKCNMSKGSKLLAVWRYRTVVPPEEVRLSMVDTGGAQRHPADTEGSWSTGLMGQAQQDKLGRFRDFDRCQAELGRFVPNPGMLDGLCSNLHVRATGARPGHAAGEQAGHRRSLPRLRSCRDGWRDRRRRQSRRHLVRVAGRAGCPRRELLRRAVVPGRAATRDVLQVWRA